RGSQMGVQKIDIKTIKQIPPQSLLRLINKAKKTIKNDKVWIELCQKYGEDPEIIDLIPTMFGDLDVSARTDHGIIILNYKLLCDGDFEKDYSYLIHEYSHFFQQCYGDKPTKGSDDGEYLKNPVEQEGFQNQVEYIANHEGEDEAEKYVENLLDHHEVNDKKDKEELADVLLEKI
ncbi:MAG: hypothetical protein WCG08_16370, partial [Paludibacter sp.]